MANVLQLLKRKKEKNFIDSTVGLLLLAGNLDTGTAVLVETNMLMFLQDLLFREVINQDI